MPYVDQHHRQQVEIFIDAIAHYVEIQPDDKRDGLLNYVVSELVGRAMKPEKGWSYHFLHRAYGVFMAAGAEFYRRCLIPYETGCIVKNGDIDAYKPRCLQPVVIPQLHLAEPKSARVLQWSESYHIWTTLCKRYHIEQRGNRERPYFVASLFSKFHIIGDMLGNVIPTLDEAMEICEQHCRSHGTKVDHLSGSPTVSKPRPYVDNTGDDGGF